MDDARRRLMWHGLLLFLLGLVTGLVEDRFANMRMGVAAHLEGLMNGTFLLALGTCWGDIHLAGALKPATYWLMLYGTYVNWATTSFAGLAGTGALTPVLAPGLKGAPWQEIAVQFGFVSCGIAILVATVLALWGLRAGAAPVAASGMPSV